LGTDRKQPHLKPLLTVRDHIFCSSTERERENMGVRENMGMLERKERRTWAVGLVD
jgi:hypothetical protein